MEELNQFYSRFDSHEFNDDLAEFRIEAEGSQILIDEIDVWKTLEQTSIRKSQGPDHISGRLLKNCALFLNSIFTLHFTSPRDMERISSGSSGKSSFS